MAKNISLYKPNIPVTRNMYGVQISGFMPEELEQIKDAASQKASKEKAITEKKRKELEQKKAEEDRIRKANDAWVKNIKDQIAKAKSEGVDTSELENQLEEYTKKTKGPNIEPIVEKESVNADIPEKIENNNVAIASQSKGTEGTIEERTRLDPIGNVYKDLNKLQNSALISGPKNISGKRPTLKIRETKSIYPTSPSTDDLYGKANSGSWDMETSVPFNDLGEQSWATTTKREFIKGSESVPEADIGTANPNNAKYTGSLYNHPRIQASVADGLLARSNIASMDTMVQVANAKGKALSEELEDKESKTKKRGRTEDVDSLTKATKGANAINAVNAAVGLGLGIYGAHQINKMQRPSMVSAPQIEAAKIRDTGAQMMTARKGMIEQSANTSREALRRAGRSDLNATITAGETRALNEAAGSIEGMRANINAANVAAENRVREINATTKMQADQFNSQLQASFNQFRSQLGSQNLSTTVQNVSANLGGIAQNNYAQALRERDEDLQLRIARLKN